MRYGDCVLIKQPHLGSIKFLRGKVNFTHAIRRYCRLKKSYSFQWLSSRVHLRAQFAQLIIGSEGEIDFSHDTLSLPTALFWPSGPC